MESKKGVKIKMEETTNSTKINKQPTIATCYYCKTVTKEI
jgi:hypothetical protein